MARIRQALRAYMLPLREIDKALPSSGNIVDLGCGDGTIAKHIAQNKKRKVLGLDKNEKRLPNSYRGNLFFKKGDLTKLRLAQSSGVVISDVLHHISYDDQKKILRKAIKSLSKNGVIVIKEIDSGEKLRSALSRMWDLILYPQDRIYYSNSTKFKKTLERLGLSVQISRPCRIFPGSTTLYICRK